MKAGTQVGPRGEAKPTDRPTQVLGLYFADPGAAQAERQPK